MGGTHTREVPRYDRDTTDRSIGMMLSVCSELTRRVLGDADRVLTVMEPAEQIAGLLDHKCDLTLAP